MATGFKPDSSNLERYFNFSQEPRESNLATSLGPGPSVEIGSHVGEGIHLKDASGMSLSNKKSLEETILDLVRDGVDISNLREFAKDISSVDRLDMVLEKFDGLSNKLSSLRDVANGIGTGDSNNFRNYFDSFGLDKNFPQLDEFTKDIPYRDELGQNVPQWVELAKDIPYGDRLGLDNVDISGLFSSDENIPVWEDLGENIPIIGGLDFSDIRDTVAQVGDTVESLTGISPDELVAYIPGAELLGFNNGSDQAETNSNSDDSDGDFESIISDIKSIGGDFAEIITDSKQFFTQLGAFVGVFGTLINTVSNTVDDYQNGKVLAGAFNLMLLVSVHIPTMSAMLFVFLKDKVHLTLKGFLKVKEDLKELAEDLESLMGGENKEKENCEKVSSAYNKNGEADMNMSDAEEKLDEWRTPMSIVQEIVGNADQIKDIYGSLDKNRKRSIGETDIIGKTVEKENTCAISKKPKQASKKNWNAKKEKVTQNNLMDTNKNKKIRRQTGGGKRSKEGESRTLTSDEFDLFNFKCSRPAMKGTLISTPRQASHSCTDKPSENLKEECVNTKAQTPQRNTGRYEHNAMHHPSQDKGNSICNQHGKQDNGNVGRDRRSIQGSFNSTTYVEKPVKRVSQDIDGTHSSERATFKQTCRDSGDHECNVKEETTVLSLKCLQENRALDNVPWTVVISKKQRRKVKDMTCGHNTIRTIIQKHQKTSNDGVENADTKD